MPRVCDDQSACTVDSCESFSGCVYTPVNGDDYNPCTFDYCDPLTGIVHEPISGGSCDDSNRCTTADTCYNGYCMGTPTDGPPEVGHLRFSFSTLFGWDAVDEPDAEAVYDVLRGAELPVSSAARTCLATGIPDLAFIDEGTPAPGSGLWYLVRARSSCGNGDYGSASDGTPRNVQGCP